MKYTTYFSAVIRDNGIPQFSAQSFKVFMNIVHLEGKIAGLKKAQGKVNETEPYKFELEIVRVHKELTNLTGNQVPKILLRNLLS